MRSTASGERSKLGRRDKIKTSGKSNGKLTDHRVTCEAHTDLVKACAIQNVVRVLNHRELMRRTFAES
jgi:hypothetical protein